MIHCKWCKGRAFLLYAPFCDVWNWQNLCRTFHNHYIRRACKSCNIKSLFFPQIFKFLSFTWHHCGWQCACWGWKDVQRLYHSEDTGMEWRCCELFHAFEDELFDGIFCGKHHTQMVSLLNSKEKFITNIYRWDWPRCYLPEWIFLCAVRFDFDEYALPQTSQLCLASLVWSLSTWDSRDDRCPNSLGQYEHLKGLDSKPGPSCWPTKEGFLLDINAKLVFAIYFT